MNTEKLLMEISSKTQFLEKWAKDPIAVKGELSLYKERGMVVYEKVMAIPSEQRIPALVQTKEGRTSVLVALVASLKSAFGNLNLEKNLDEEQVVDLADKIIDASHEDNLSVQDILLFLEQFLMGKTGKLFNRLDMPTFFEHLEKYRQERHLEFIRVKEEKEAYYKSLGRGGAVSKTNNIDRNIDPTVMGDLLQTVINGKDE